MLRISPVKNVNNTLNNQPTFRAGVQTNYGLATPPRNNIVENGLLTTFIGAVKKLVKSSPEVNQRAESIQRGLDKQKRIDAIA